MEEGDELTGQVEPPWMRRRRRARMLRQQERATDSLRDVLEDLDPHDPLICPPRDQAKVNDISAVLISIACRAHTDKTLVRMGITLVRTAGWWIQVPETALVAESTPPGAPTWLEWQQRRDAETTVEAWQQYLKQEWGHVITGGKLSLRCPSCARPNGARRRGPNPQFALERLRSVLVAARERGVYGTRRVTDDVMSTLVRNPHLAASYLAALAPLGDTDLWRDLLED